MNQDDMRRVVRGNPHIYKRFNNPNWELYKRLQDPIEAEKATDAPEPVDTVEYWQERARVVEERYEIAQEIIQRSANVYLRYYRLRHRLLLWWKRVTRG